MPPASPSARFFEPLVRDLVERSASSLLGIYGPRTDSLRTFLSQVLQKPAGHPDSFLADPVFEAIFDWETADVTMSDLAERDFLTEALVAAMGTEADDERLKEYVFPRSRQPFTHQYEAWEYLKRRNPRSVIITSGTGSGKTEGFLVPILDDLVRRAERERLRGVRALFLYPLNALINSQRDRLSAWSRPFNGNLRYCLYKGDTPNKLSAAEGKRLDPELVGDRTTLREDPPPILVTNATMLEYMLVRLEDKPIIDQSKGLLRWIVLDEAHTYQGSRSAEIALLLRRVLYAFDVEPSEVRFVATSATIGDESDESEDRLRDFLADLGGVDRDQVHVVRGARGFPDLSATTPEAPDEPLPSIDALRRMEPSERGAKLAAAAVARRIRRELLASDGVLTLNQLTKIRLDAASGAAAADAAPGGPAAAPSAAERRETLELIDIATSAKVDGEWFLRVRCHLFHRTQGGVWACISQKCPGRNGTPLASFEWPFGKLFFGRRARCDECGSLVLAMVLCAECGKEYLAGRMVLEDRTLVPRDVGVVEQTDDVPELVDYGSEEEDDDEDDGRGDGLDRYLAHPATPKVPTIHLDRRTGRWVGSDADAALEFGEVLPATSGHPRCPECRTSRRADWLLRPLRGGASLILRNTIPIMLDYTPELADRGSEPLPHAGRRLLTFTDSRQGTARFALTAQLDSERNYTRGAIYHQTAAERTDHAPDPARIAQLKSEIAALEEVKPENAQIQKIIAEKKAGLATLTGPRLGCRAWKDAIEKLSRETEISKWLPDHWRHLPLADLEAHELAEIALLREFARRPKRQTSLETLGFVSVEYPRLAATGSEPPSPWRMRGLDAGEWRNFLKLMLDHLVRGRRCIEVEGAFIPWLGVPHRPTVLIGPDAERFEGAVRWPLAAGPTLRSRFVQLLALILEVDPSESGAARAEIDACLRLAWRQISAVLVTSGPGHRLNFGEGVALREIRDAWLCPITRRVLDTTVMGLTPYVVSGLHRKDLTARPVRMPRLKTPFWRKPMGGTYSRDEIDQAIRDDPDIAEAERLGVWRGWSRRIFEHVDYFQVAEHSAQLSAARLRDLEDRFRRGRVNVLSCSTTMEMGVDIGGLSAVAMNNAPPSPANYLQRAGRAGRRGESRAIGLTLCNTSAHGEHVFRNPLWPFKTPLHVTRVGLHSERIVRRHVNALTLTRFFANRFQRQEFHRLSAGWFFEQREDKSSVCEQFRSWLGDVARSDPWLETGLRRLLRGSKLAGIEPDRLLSMVEDRIAAAASAWAAEAEPLRRELDGLAGHASADVVRRAIELQLRRLREEYLLRELAVRNFLPGYGFPTQVVPLVTTTKDDLKWRRRRRTDASGDREDNFSRARQYPTRHLSAALHEYGPGASVILDGRVLTSSGLTLNWKIPATDEAAREVQALRHTWRCRHCGAVGTGIRPLDVCESGYCAGRESPLEAHSYIEPAGFAVDIRDSLNNDLSRFSYVPTKPPRISTGGEPWQSLAVSALGRFRYSASGRVFHHTAGEYGYGFAICLHCGRAVAEHEKEGELPKRMQGHKPLRGGSTAGPDDLCSGNDGTHKIRRNEWLGVSRETDVFEFQLRPVLVAPATDTDGGTDAKEGIDAVTASSIAIALREALAQRIGVEDREIGWAIKEARVEETGEKNVSILLYDHATGGAGFVAQAPEHLPALLRRARGTLDCARRCDKACHACLLSYDTHHAVDRVDRHRALDVLSDTFLAALDLPAEEQMFGPETRFEFEPIKLALQRGIPPADTVRLHLGGDASQWSLRDWTLSRDLLRWTQEGCRVELVLPRNVDGIPRGERLQLAFWGRTLGVRLLRGRVPRPGRPVLAELSSPGRAVTFAAQAIEALVPGPDWGVSGEGAHVVKGYTTDAPTTLAPVEPSQLDAPPPGQANRLALSDHLRAPINAVGPAFWQAIRTASPALSERLGRGLPIREVVYQDRYVRSPLVARILLEVFAELARAAGDGLHDARFRILTTPPNERASPGRQVQDDWTLAQDAKKTIEHLFHTASISASVVLRNAKRTPHERKLEITWDDGTRWHCHLDHGFGFVRTARTVSHSFSDSPQRQAKALAAATFDVDATGPGRAYVFGLE